MKPWIQVDTVAIPGDKEMLRLREHDGAFSISVGATELMDSRRSQSEKALATMTCARLRDSARAQMLIGGLGMGFTLRAALDTLGPQARVVVAELVPGVVAWARGPLSHLFEDSLDDTRVELRIEDVRQTIHAGRDRYDAILLDVDNGPEGFTRRANDRLYDVAGLRNARDALRAGGILAVWSNGPDRTFTTRLRGIGFEVEEVRVHAHGTSGRRHVLWFARRS